MTKGEGDAGRMSEAAQSPETTAPSTKRRKLVDADCLTPIHLHEFCAHPIPLAAQSTLNSDDGHNKPWKPDNCSCYETLALADTDLAGWKSTPKVASLDSILQMSSCGTADSRENRTGEENRMGKESRKQQSVAGGLRNTNTNANFTAVASTMNLNDQDSGREHSITAASHKETEPGIQLSEAALREPNALRSNADFAKNSIDKRAADSEENDRLAVVSPITSLDTFKAQRSYGCTIYEGPSQFICQETHPTIKDTSMEGGQFYQSQTRQNRGLILSTHGTVGLPAVLEILEDNALEASQLPHSHTPASGEPYLTGPQPLPESPYPSFPDGGVTRASEEPEDVDFMDGLSDADFLELAENGMDINSETKPPVLDGPLDALIPLSATDASVKALTDPAPITQQPNGVPIVDTCESSQTDWVVVEDEDDALFRAFGNAISWDRKSETGPSSPRRQSRTARPPVPLTDPSLETATGIAGSSRDYLRRPIIRGSFPQPVKDRSPIIGLSASTILRTCFRIGEAFRVGSQAARESCAVIVELYAKVASSHRQGNGLKQHFVFSDLFHDRPPCLDGVRELRKGVEHWEYDSWRFLEQVTGNGLCRCVGKMRKEGQRWVFHVLSIREATWEEVEHVKGIVCA